jgi:hypothetical protein
MVYVTTVTTIVAVVGIQETVVEQTIIMTTALIVDALIPKSLIVEASVDHPFWLAIISATTTTTIVVVIGIVVTVVGQKTIIFASYARAWIPPTPLPHTPQLQLPLFLDAVDRIVKQVALNKRGKVMVGVMMKTTTVDVTGMVVIAVDKILIIITALIVSVWIVNSLGQEMIVLIFPMASVAILLGKVMDFAMMVTTMQLVIGTLVTAVEEVTITLFVIFASAWTALMWHLKAITALTQ